MRSVYHNETISSNNPCNEEANRIKRTERTGLTWAADEELKNDERHERQQWRRWR